MFGSSVTNSTCSWREDRRRTENPLGRRRSADGARQLARARLRRCIAIIAQTASLGLDDYHPGDAETVRHHAEPRRKEGLLHWHLHRPAVVERGEYAVRVRGVLRGVRQREALKD